jgi:hypothetical protein
MMFRPIQIEDSTPQIDMDVHYARKAEVARVRLVHQEYQEVEEMAE